MYKLCVKSFSSGEFLTITTTAKTPPTPPEPDSSVYEFSWKHCSNTVIHLNIVQVCSSVFSAHYSDKYNSRPGTRIKSGIKTQFNVYFRQLWGTFPASSKGRSQGVRQCEQDKIDLFIYQLCNSNLLYLRTTTFVFNTPDREPIKFPFNNSMLGKHTVMRMANWILDRVGDLLCWSCWEYTQTQHQRSVGSH